MRGPTPEGGSGPISLMVVDAGGEPWERVEPLLARRMGELPPTAVLELLATEPEVCAALPQWCTEHGHALDLGEPDGCTSVLRIHKSPLELR